MNVNRYDTGAITLLPDKVAALNETGQLGPMLVPPHLRGLQQLTVFDPLNNTNQVAIQVDRWEPIAPDSFICVPKNLELQVIDTIKVPEKLWGDVNQAITGTRWQNCAAVNHCMHAHPLEDLFDIYPDPGAYTRTIERAVRLIQWEHDSIQYQNDRAFLDQLHMLSHQEQAHALTQGTVKTFCVRSPWMRE